MQRCICNTILPLVFDDSLSYLECLAKIKNTVNQIIGLINNDLDSTIEQYINEHFDELMISATYDAPTETIILTNKTKEI